MPPQFPGEMGFGPTGDLPTSFPSGFPSGRPDDPFGTGGFGAPFDTSGGGGAPPVSGMDQFLRILSVVVPLAGAFYNARTANEAEEAQRRAVDEAKRILSPEEYNRLVTTLLPSMRAQSIAGPGQQASQAIDTAVSRGRLTGTGVGEAFKVIGSSLPGIEATRGATAQALGLQTASAEAILQGASLYDPKRNPLVDALNAALGGYFEYEARRGRGKTPAAPQQPSLFPTRSA